MIMVTLLCGRVLSERALRPLLSFSIVSIAFDSVLDCLGTPGLISIFGVTFGPKRQGFLT